MVAVDVRVPELDDELVRLRARHMCDHMCQQRVRRDVERDAEPQVRRPLVHQEGEARLPSRVCGREVDVELAHHMAREERHSGEVCV